MLDPIQLEKHQFKQGLSKLNHNTYDFILILNLISLTMESTYN
jgi:hypothetical protein